MADQLDKEVKEAIEKLKKIKAGLNKRQLQKPLKQSARILTKQAKRNIPKSRKPHHRYDTPKISGKQKAPKGMGRIVATYFPGNLRRAFI